MGSNKNKTGPAIRPAKNKFNRSKMMKNLEFSKQQIYKNTGAFQMTELELCIKYGIPLNQ